MTEEAPFFLPTTEVNLVSPQVYVGIREDGADLFKKLCHKVIRGV